MKRLAVLVGGQGRDARELAEAVVAGARKFELAEEWVVVTMPDGRLEVEVGTKLEAVLLNKISRKSQEIREQVEVGLKAGRRFRDEFLRQSPAGASAQDMVDAAEAVRLVYQDLMQVLDISHAAGVDPGLVVAASSTHNPSFRWGPRE